MGGQWPPSVSSESIQPLTINEENGISLQNFVIFFENAINREKCRSSSIEQVLCTALYRWGLSTRDAFVQVPSVFLEKMVKSIQTKYASGE